MESLFIPLALVAGGLLTVQAGANAQLSQAAGSPFTATTVQLSVGAIVLLLAAAITGSLDALARLPGAQWWHGAGGVRGVARAPLRPLLRAPVLCSPSANARALGATCSTVSARASDATIGAPARTAVRRSPSRDKVPERLPVFVSKAASVGPLVT